MEFRHALECALRGERVGIWLPDMALARRVSQLMFAPMVSEADLEGRKTVYDWRFASGGYVIFGWSGSASQFRNTGYDVAVGDEWSELAPDVAYQGRPTLLLRSRVRASANPRVVLSSSPASGGDALLASEATAGVSLEWLLKCPACGKGSSPRLDRLSEAGLACEQCGTVSEQSEWLSGRFGRLTAATWTVAGGCSDPTGSPCRGRPPRRWLSAACATRRSPGRRTCPSGSRAATIRRC